MPGRRSSESQPRNEHLLALAVALLVVPLAYFLRFGYRFGHGDQDEFLPQLMARLNGSLAGDWFVAGQLEAFNVRSGFVWLLEGPAGILGVEAAVMSLFIVTGIGIVSALFFLAMRFGGHPAGGVVAALAVVALVPRWTLGGNAIASSMLVPSMVAWAFGLWAIVCAAGRRERTAGILIGLAAWVQVLVAAQIGALCLLGLLWRERRLSTPVLHFTAPALALAAPVAALLLLSETGGSGSFDILARVRAPHHYLPTAFPLRDYFQTGLLGLAGILAFRRTRLSRPAAVNRFFQGMLAAIAAALALGFAGWLAGVESFLVLQPFKTSVAAGAVFVCALAASLPRLAFPPWAWGGALILLVGGWTLVLRGYRVLDRPPLDTVETREIESLIGGDTDQDALFAAPPSVTGFRFHAQRPLVVNFKAFPFGERHAAEWYERLRDWSPGVLPEDPEGFAEGGAAVLGRLDEAFESLSPLGAATLVERYGVSYLLRRTSFAEPDTLFELVNRAGPFFLYRPISGSPSP